MRRSIDNILMLSFTIVAASAEAQPCPRAEGKWGYGPARSVAVSGSYLYLNSGSRLLVADLTNPASVPVIGQLQLPDEIMGLAVSGSYLFAIAEQVGLHVIDVSTPAVPTEVGSLALPGWSRRVAVAGSFVYVANGWSGVRVIDVSNPAAPGLIGTADTPFFATDVALFASGKMAAVADAESGLRVIDFANPASPVEVGFLDTPGSAEGVAISGSTVYLADAAGGLRVIDASTPSSPVERGVLPAPDWWPSGVAISGTLAYIAGGDGLHVADVSNPTAPSEIGVRTLGGFSRGVAAAGSLALLASDAEGVHVVNVATPSAPVVTFNVTVPGHTWDVAFDGDWAILANGEHGLRVLDVADPANPHEVASIETPGIAYAVAVVDHIAYVADGNTGLRIIDVGIPGSPVPRGSYMLGATANDIVVAGSHAYIANGAAGLAILDVSDPDNVTLAATLALTGNSRKLALAGSHAFIADDTVGLRIVDISNPAAPAEVGEVPTPGGALSVAVRDGLAYVGADSGDLVILDVSTPASPSEIDVFSDVSNPVDLLLAGSFLYVAEFASGLTVLSVADPENPERVGGADTPGITANVAAASGLVAVADREVGAAFFNVSSCPLTLCSLSCSATAQPLLGLPPLAVSFGVEVTATRCTGDTTYDWDFGDGSPHSSLERPSHVYASVGSFPWSVTVTVGAQQTSCSGTVAVAVAPPRHFDFGTAASPLAPGYTRVTHSSTFAAAIGYGWSSGVRASRDRGVGPDLTRDFVFSANAGFDVVVPAGCYDVSLTMGDASARHDDMGVFLETRLVDSVTTNAGVFVTRTYRVEVADGVLNLSLDDLGGSDSFVVINALVIADSAPRRFDFGTAASPVASGYQRVAHTAQYAETQGYGWQSGTIASRDRGSGGDLNRDFNFTPLGTFAVDVTSGVYDVIVTMGDATGGHDQMGIYLEGTFVDSVTTTRGAFVTRRYRTAVGDGQLTLTLDDLGGGDANVVINALEVYGGAGGAPGTVPAGDVPKAIPDTQTITSALELSGFAGTVADVDVTLDITHTYDADLDVFLIGPNATRVELFSDVGGSADNFTNTTLDDEEPLPISAGEAPFARRYRPAGSLAALDGQDPNGTWTLEVSDDQAGDAGTLNSWSLTLVTALAPVTRRFDFGTATSPVASSCAQVTHTMTHNASRGYGWISGTVGSRDRGTFGDLHRDFCFTAAGTFVADVPPGWYDVTVTMGDATTRHDQMRVEMEGNIVGTFTTLAAQFTGIVTRQQVSDGQLTVRLTDLGGSDTNVVINALVVTPVTP